MKGWGIALAIAVLAPLAARAASPPPPPTEPGAPDGGFDWVQLDSGEWLPGEFLRMLDEKLDFDSEEFDEQEFDWGDVVSLVSSGQHTFRIEGREPIQGTFEMRDRVLRIDTGTEVIEVPASRVLSVIPGEGRERDFWSFHASLSYTGQRGNTNQADLSVRADLKRESPLTRWVTSYRGSFGASNGKTTSTSHRVPSRFDYFLTSRLFVTIASLEYYTDRFQNISARVTAGSALGYKLVDRSRVDWEVSGGAGYQLTSYESVLPGEASRQDDAAVLLGTSLDFDFPHGIEWDNSYRVQLVVTDLGKTSHHAESILDLDIWGPLDFELGFIFDRIEQPRRAADGTRPKSNDYRVTVGLGVEF